MVTTSRCMWKNEYSTITGSPCYSPSLQLLLNWEMLYNKPLSSCLLWTWFQKALMLLFFMTFLLAKRAYKHPFSTCSWVRGFCRPLPYCILVISFSVRKVSHLCSFLLSSESAPDSPKSVGGTSLHMTSMIQMNHGIMIISFCSVTQQYLNKVFKHCKLLCFSFHGAFLFHLYSSIWYSYFCRVPGYRFWVVLVCSVVRSITYKWSWGGVYSFVYP